MLLELRYIETWSPDVAIFFWLLTCTVGRQTISRSLFSLKELEEKSYLCLEWQIYNSECFGFTTTLLNLEKQSSSLVLWLRLPQLSSDYLRIFIWIIIEKHSRGRSSSRTKILTSFRSTVTRKSNEHQSASR